MINRTLSVLATGLLAAAGPALGADYTFDGGPDGTGTAWDLAANWAPDGVPGPGDTATIGTDGPPSTTYTVMIAASLEVAGLELRGGSNLQITNAATVTVTGNAVFNGDLGGGDDAYVDLLGDGTIALDGAASFRACGLEDTTTLIVNGTLADNGAGAFAQMTGTEFTTLEINGAVSLGGEDLINNGFSAGTVTVNPSGSITVLTDGWTMQSHVHNDLVNHGTIRVDCGADHTCEVFYLAACDGNLDVDSGTLRLADGRPAVLSGAVTVAANATLECRGGAPGSFVFQSPPEMSGDGRLLVQGGVTFDEVNATITLVECGDVPERDLRLVGTSSIVDLDVSDEIRGDGMLIVNGTAILRSGTTLGFDSAGAGMTLNGPSTVEGLAIGLDAELVFNHDGVLTGNISNQGGGAGGPITIAPGVTVTLDGAVDVGGGAGSSNQGTLVKVGAGEARLLSNGGSPGLANDGLIQVLEGAILDEVSVLHTGDVEISAGALYAVTFGAYGPDAEWTGDGTAEIRNNFSNCCWVDHDGTIDVAHGELRDRLRGAGMHTFDTVTTYAAELGGTMTIDVGDLTMEEYVTQQDECVVRVLGSCTKNKGWNIFDASRLDIEGELTWTDQTFGPSGSNGTIAVRAGGTLVCTAADDDCYVPFENEGQMIMNNTGLVRFIASAESSNNGLMVVGSETTQFLNGSPAQGPSGATRIDGGVLDVAGGTLTCAAGLLGGVGTLAESVNAPAAAISPGLSPGEFVIDGDLTLGADASIVVEIGGPTQGVDYDHLTVTGNASIDGLLLIGYADGYEPAIGQSFTILTAGSVSGSFPSVAGLGEYDVSVTSTEVIVTVTDPDNTCPSDASGDDETSFPDILEILANWGPCPDPPDPCPADTNGDGVVNFTDLLVVLGSWGPCPENVAYDVTFSSPLHTVGAPPTIGAGAPVRETVSFLGGRAPEIVAAVGGLDDQPVRMFWQYLGGGGGSTTYFNLFLSDLPEAPRWRLEADVVIDSMSGRHEFAVRALLTHDSSPPRVVFSPVGLTAIVGFNQGQREYTNGVPVRIRFELDLEADTAEVFVDDDLVTSGPIGVTSRLATFLVYGRGRSSGTGVAGIDNIKITALE